VCITVHIYVGLVDMMHRNNCESFIATECLVSIDKLVICFDFCLTL